MLRGTDDPIEFLESLRRGHEAARPRDGIIDDCFVLIADEASGRRIAVSEYGSLFYDEGLPVYFVVDVASGAYVRFNWSRESGSVPKPLGEDGPLVRAFLKTDSIDSRDPIRLWLASKGKTTKVRIETAEQMRRFCAAEIVRTDHPELFPVPEPDYSPLRWKEAELALLGEHFDADVLPYFVLFGKHFAPVTSIGSGRGRLGRTRERAGR